MTEIGDYIFFYGSDWPSNFAKATIKIKDKMHQSTLFDNTPKYITFNDSETYYQSWKAVIMNDRENYYRIVISTTPAMSKKLARNIKLDPKLWDKSRDVVMYSVLRHKFLQNQDLLDELLSDKYDGKIFVEASPTDKYWGIGFSEEQAKDYIDRNGINPMDDPGVEKGKNMLGKLLNELRKNLILAKKNQI